MSRSLLKVVGAVALPPVAAVLVAASYGAPHSASAPVWRAGPADSASVMDSVFSEAQAKRGEAIFQEICTKCHTINQFTKGPYKPLGRFPTLGDFFIAVTSEMPQDNPGSLSYPEYAAVMSYILQQDGYPAGPNDLPPDINKLLPIRVVPLPAKE